MTGWFTRLMHDTRARTQSENASVSVARDPRYDGVVHALRSHGAEDAETREKRQRGYSQHLKSDTGTASSIASATFPDRLARFRTRVPCRATAEARAMLGQLRAQFPGSVVTFRRVAEDRLAMMLSGGGRTAPRQIGWAEQCVETDPARCHVRHHGLRVETDGASMLVLRFRYPSTPARVASAPPASPDVSCAHFSEVRPALDLRLPAKNAPPRLVWVTRHERETINALRERDYEAFYVRFKREVLAGVWHSLWDELARAPESAVHLGSYYRFARTAQPANGKIHERTIDDRGRLVDIGSDRTYDAFPATDILLLHLEPDILADVADIYFTLESVSSADAWFLKEEFFAVIRKFWSGSRSLASCYGSSFAAVVRMAQRALPMPAQAPLLTQDWTRLRQALLDRYGKGGDKVTALAGRTVQQRRAPAPAWPFAWFPAGEVNLGLRLVYRQEWTQAGTQRGDVIGSIPSLGGDAPCMPVPDGRQIVITEDEAAGRVVETTVEQEANPRTLDQIVRGALASTAQAMHWAMDAEGTVETGMCALAARTDMGVERQSRASSRETSNRLTEIMLRMATRLCGDQSVARASAVEAEDGLPSPDEGAAVQASATVIRSRLQNQYEIVTRPAEIENVVLVAEKLPTSADIDRAWVRRHDWILRDVLLDESFRVALETIGQESRKLERKRQRLYDHIRANVLHYQRAIWRQEDPQQRSLRYRKSGKKVPLQWRFELEMGGVTIDELGERLAGDQVDAQFAAYATSRELGLDEVIDPAGPIGYSGNYAVYRMRPEFGSNDLFAMLHFFKSPYLQADAASGALAVEDPMHIGIREDAVPSQDRALVERARVRRLVIDTDSVVVDTIRCIESEAGLARSHEVPAADVCTLRDLPTEPPLAVDGAREIDLRIATGHRDGEWVISRVTGMTLTALTTGVAAAGSVNDATLLLPQRLGPPSLRLSAGTSAARRESADAEVVIPVSRDGGETPQLMLARPAPGGDGRITVATNDQWLRPSPVLGASPTRPVHLSLTG